MNRHKNLLLDTHTLLWVLNDAPQLSKAKPYIEQANNIYVSMASWWEISIKASLNKLPIDPQMIFIEAQQAGIKMLPIQIAHCQKLLSLATIHRDPFDRMLIAQSITESLPLLTHDETLASYTKLVTLF
ncbi:MAG TPA: type II toxin-antitoxin system VapC family toxin [Agitococcus sp.]|nr:type II toxin-antitoxin system VapC family toxin [Agitococcus sp.]